MNRRHRHRATLLCLIGWLCASVWGCAAPRAAMHPQFTARHRAAQVVAVMPADVTIQRATFEGAQEPLYEAMRVAAKALASAAVELLTARGYAVRVLDAETLQPAQRATLDQLYAQFARDGERASRHVAWEMYDYSVGAPANVFADLTTSDLLLVVQCEAVEKSRGEVARDAAKSVLKLAATLGHLWSVEDSAVTVLQVGLVDGHSGDILWHHSNTKAEDIYFRATDITKLTAAFRRLFKSVPTAAR